MGLGFQFRGRVLHKPTVTALGNSKIIAHLHLPSSSRVVYADPPDWPEMLVWQHELRKGELFIDVGANIGLYSVLAAEHEAEVIAIEPIGHAGQKLRENLALNGYDATVLEIALADRPGTMRIINRDTQSHLLINSEGGQEIAVDTLDNVLGNRTAHLKIDVEGAERLVLEGAERALSEHRIRLMQLEWNDTCVKLLGETREPLIEYLTSFGYDLFRPDDVGVLIPDSKPKMGRDVFAKVRRR